MNTAEVSVSRVISRQEAKTKGLKRYYTGKPCSKGHVDERLVNNKTCWKCHVSKLLEVKKVWRTKNPPRKSEIAYRDKTRNHRNVLGRERYKSNPSPHRIKTKNQKATRRGAKGKFSEFDINKLFEAQEGKCLCSADLVNFHVDHKTPVSRRGSNHPSNLQLLCAPCNLNKGAKTMEEWTRGKVAS